MHHPLPPPLNPEPLMQTIADSSKKKNLNALQRTTQKCQQLSATDPIVVGDCPGPSSFESHGGEEKRETSDLHKIWRKVKEIFSSSFLFV